MTTGSFSATEWKQLVNAPQLIYHLLTVADRGGFFTKRSEAKALQDYLHSHRSQSALVRSIIAGQKDADDKIEASPEEAQKVRTDRPGAGCETTAGAGCFSLPAEAEVASAAALLCIDGSAVACHGRLFPVDRTTRLAYNRARARAHACRATGPLEFGKF